MNKITITHKDDFVFVPLANSEKTATGLHPVPKTPS
jgi:hypothetical protein